MRRRAGTEVVPTQLGKLRHPEELEASPLGRWPSKWRHAIGVDLGTNCGIASAVLAPNQPGEPLKVELLSIGQLDLSVGPYDTGPLRFLRLCDFLSRAAPDVIFYEDPKFTGTGPTPSESGKPWTIGAVIARVASSLELLAAMRCVLTMWAESHNVPTHAFGIGEIKKFATGKGNAGKPAMIEACNSAYGTTYNSADFSDGEDNEADAAHALFLGLTTYWAGLTCET